MGRRRKAPPPKPFEDAFKGIDALEQNVWLHTNDPAFVGEDTVRWLLDGDIVDKLQAAYPYTRAPDRTANWHLDVMLALQFPAQKCSLTIKCNSVEVHMLVPEHGLAKPRPSHPADSMIMASLRAAYGVHHQFEKVRKVVRWLNDFATIGAARHYCPWLTSILPHDHPFQEATGQTYREPHASMVGIAGTMRECGAIMASALLAGEPEDKTRNVFSVAFEREGGIDKSNTFTIL